MTEKERIQGEIKMLQSKLSFLEELERYKTPAEEAYKEWWGEYPGTETWSNYDETRWVGFQAGYEAAQAKDTEVKECPDEYVKLPTLYEIVADWWDEIFLHNNEAGETIESLVDTIEEDWFPVKDNGGDRYACGWNDCLEKLSLRLK